MGRFKNFLRGRSSEGNDVDSPKEQDRPRVTFEFITFSDGRRIDLSDDEIVVFVGPNNAGKSATLRELERALARPQDRSVILREHKLKWSGSPSLFLAWLEKYSVVEDNPRRYRGLNYNIMHGWVGLFGTDGQPGQGDLAGFFASRVGTDSRLTGSNAAGAIQLHYQPADHPIHLLLADEAEAQRISSYFKRAFGQELITFRAGGSKFPLLVGHKPQLRPNSDELSKRFVDDLKLHSSPLEDQGDGMRSFATVLLHVLVAENYSVQFLDEPEAFLHPPQARLLGEYITRERRSKAQLFVATHSPDVLEGILGAGSSKVRIIRMQRDGEVNHITELSKSRTAAIASSPLTRYSGVLSGIFHQRVIIAESESDCLFYNAVLNTRTVIGSDSPDVLFIHSGGKDRMKDLAGLLRELDVPVSVIADIDILSDGEKFQRLFESLGGDWIEVQSDWVSLNKVILQARPPLSADQVRSRIEVALDGVSGSQPFPRDVERNIKGVLKELSPWQQIKRLGKIGIDRGEPLHKFDRIWQKCSERGLWIVHVGELEGFCRSIEAGHGPDFTEKVLLQRDIENDPELEEARQFMRKLWLQK
ncbi:AAA family ATPase [Bradyrhizobium sp. CB1717]|uniref:ATP-dependent nuclease n=1 Tax=Bradyrhizobium sp. CB1717 TaxID=3039154 RepID=UPI0024B0F3BC|nr:AAA family ATPase [Bradyrhizobium sp. CB1717]WFU28704.1 AAA family ATPase [Bradyrhizobium sp. CB1717]